MKTMTIKYVYVTVMMMFFIGSVFAQGVSINDNGSSPNSKAILDVSSTTKGFLPPRMTYSEKTAIASPPAGLMVWCSNCGIYGELQVFNGTAWTNLTGGTASGAVPGAPTIGIAIAGYEQASVPFTAPASNGGSTITSYTATSSPGNITGTLFQSGSGTITVTGLTNGTAYTFTVTATNATGTSAASDASNSVTPLAYYIGQSYGGGIIFYIDGTGQHGLISATIDQSTLAQWGCYGTSISTSTDIGSGQANTTAIVTGCVTAGIAARICNDLVLNGYSDWFLPSKDELNQMYLQKANIGVFADNSYWSSSEATATKAWYQVFGNAWQGNDRKDTFTYIRAIRAF